MILVAEMLSLRTHPTVRTLVGTLAALLALGNWFGFSATNVSAVANP